MTGVDTFRMEELLKIKSIVLNEQPNYPYNGLKQVIGSKKNE